MWVNNSAAMSRYQSASAQAVPASTFASAPEIVNPAGVESQAAATSSARATAAAATAAAAGNSPLDVLLQSLGVTFDPNSGWFGLANTYANQFISSGFPINMLSLFAQFTSAQALQAVAPEIGEGLSEGENALGASAASLSDAARALGAVESAPTALVGAGFPLGRVMAPPAVVGLLPAAQMPVQLASAASPLPAGDTGFP